MAYYCTRCDSECGYSLCDGMDYEPIVVSDCCRFSISDVDGNLISPEDLPEAQAWIERGAMAQEK